jgi:hypothetical protein
VEDDLVGIVGTVLSLDSVVEGTGGSVSNDLVDGSHVLLPSVGSMMPLPFSSEFKPSFIGASNDASGIDELMNDGHPDLMNDGSLGDAELSKIGFEPLVGLRNGHLLELDMGKVVEGLENDVGVSLLESELVEQFPCKSRFPHVFDIRF